MRELLSLRRDEMSIIGEVYRYKNEFLKCVADNGLSSGGCRKCYFDAVECAEVCGALCEADARIPTRHFERVPKDKLETAADIKFRHVEETKGDPPLIGERFIATVGLVEFVNGPNARVIDCAYCDLTQRECDESSCGCGFFYQRVKQ